MSGKPPSAEWTPAADEDLDAIAAYISQDNPAAAVEQVLRIIDLVEDLLVENPALGRPGRVPGTRELVVSGTPFIVAYRVRADRVQVLRLIHGARQWPEQL